MKTELEIAIKKVRNALKRVIDETEKTRLREELKRLKSSKAEKTIQSLSPVSSSLDLTKDVKLSA